MGRRALRKVDSTIDLSRHLLSWDELPDPWDAAHLFGRRAPVEIEVKVEPFSIYDAIAWPLAILWMLIKALSSGLVGALFLLLKRKRM